MGNPLKSEAAAFRWLMVVLAAAITVGALAALTRPLIGLLWAVLLVCAGAALLYRRRRGGDLEGRPRTRGGDGRHRLLVIGGETVGAAPVLEEIGRRSEGRDSEILVIAPAPAAAGDEGILLARQRMELAVIEIEHRLGRSTRGEIGDADPNVAIADALRVFPADEVVIATQPPQLSSWLERSVVDRARRETGLPVAHVVVDPPA